jgi:hypothetical protein
MTDHDRWRIRQARHQGRARSLLSSAIRKRRFYSGDTSRLPGAAAERAVIDLLVARARLHLDIGPLQPKPDKWILVDHAWALDRYRAARDAEGETDATLRR